MERAREWVGLNREHVWAEIGRVRDSLAGQVREPAAWNHADEPALETLRRRFKLSRFEYDLLVLCAGQALDPALAADVRSTFSFALSKFPHAHLDATNPSAPLRLFKLLAMHSFENVLHTPLVLDERVLQFMFGIESIDAQLLPYLLPIPARLESPTGGQGQVAARLGTYLRGAERGTVIQVVGAHGLSRLAVVHEAASTAGMRVLRLRANALALPAPDLSNLQRIVDREVLLDGSLPVIELDVLDSPEVVRAARIFASGLTGVSAISTHEVVPMPQLPGALFEVPAGTVHERRAAWATGLGSRAAGLEDEIDRLAYQFRLDPAEIADIIRVADPNTSGEQQLRECWRLALERSRPRIDDIARRIIPSTGWDDLVVPPNISAALRAIVEQLRHRHAVHERWGFARGDSRGQAITALFAGPSGTGKTLAAEVIARETGLDLYHIDLSQVVDKYVGETEKRLRRVFDAAESGGAILLFDEADALFGKRGDVERATDRWANLEVSYLLQRMETYSGLAILTTNAKDALDHAFLRRLRFVVPFPFPDVRLRSELWRRVIPRDAEAADLDPTKLARLQLTGANIKSVAINAAFHAASEGTMLMMRHLVRAARSELAKLEVPFPEAEVQSWGVSVERT